MKKTLNRYVLTDEIYNLIKVQILSHDLAPGNKINIDQLARELEVSNIPIREALSRLAAEGLVLMIPFKGMFVTNMTLKELDEIFEVRIELESMALRKAITVIPNEELINLIEKMNKWREFDLKSTDEKLQLVSDMNEGLHGLILRNCGNSTLKQMVIMCIEKIERYLKYIHQDIDPNCLEIEWNEHWGVLCHLQKRDTEMTVKAMQNHLHQSYQRTRLFFETTNSFR